jgi:hypothetical protein
MLSTLFFVTISGLSLTAMLLGVRQLWKRHAPFVVAGGVMLALCFLTLPAAHATDRILINGDGCQVTEEDAVGIFLHSDLYLRIDFPDSHWRFGLRNLGLKGLNVVDVGIQAAQFTSKQYIIKRAGLTELFVPYDDRSATYFDMDDRSYGLDQIDPADLPPQNGALVYLRTLVGGYYVRDTIPKVAVECREAGIGWLCKQGNDRVRRRIHDVVVWGVFDSGNYDYITQYTFHEDGGISFRVGATGYNLSGGESKPHVHNGLWRVSTKLFDRLDNEAVEWVHVEDSQGYIATDSQLPIPTEESYDWDPPKFSSIMIQSATQTNDYGHLMGYAFLPGDRTGTGRFSTRPEDHEMFTHHDEYLTNEDPGEDGTGSGTNNWLYTPYSPDYYLLTYLNGEPIGGTGDGVVLWYFGSVHHEPTDADNRMGSGGRTGITLVHWSGFDMVSHNMFDYNPLGGPPNCAGY